MKKILLLLVLTIIACNPTPIAKTEVRASTATARGPVIPSSWTVANWYIDPANSTTNASDNNNCTTSSTPCLTWGEIVNRWGGCVPCTILQQTTTVNFLSSQTLNTDPVFVDDIKVVGGFFFVLQGVYTSVGTGTLNVVTAKNRATPQLLTSTFTGTTPTQGQIVHNTTHPSRAWADSVSTGTVTLTQPLQIAPTPSGFPSLPNEVDTWTTGDAITIEVPPTVNLRKFFVESNDSKSSPASLGAGWIQAIHAPDNTFNGNPALTGFSKLPVDGLTYTVWDSRFDTAVVSSCKPQAGATGVVSYFDNCWLDGGIAIVGNSGVFGGDVAIFNGETVVSAGAGSPPSGTTGVSGAQAILDGDVIAHEIDIYNTTIQLGLVYVPNHLALLAAGAIDTAVDTSGAAIWGPGSLNVVNGGGLRFQNSLTVASTLLLTGALKIDSATTATKYLSGTWTDGVTITAAAIDTNTALMNPQSGSIITKALP